MNYCFILKFQGEVLFNSWKDLFNGDGGLFSQQARIYSFSGKNILTDFAWWVKWNKILLHYCTSYRAFVTFCNIITTDLQLDFVHCLTEIWCFKNTKFWRLALPSSSGDTSDIFWPQWAIIKEFHKYNSGNYLGLHVQELYNSDKSNFYKNNKTGKRCVECIIESQYRQYSKLQ